MPAWQGCNLPACTRGQRASITYNEAWKQCQGRLSFCPELLRLAQPTCSAGAKAACAACMAAPSRYPAPGPGPSTTPAAPYCTSLPHHSAAYLPSGACIRACVPLGYGITDAQLVGPATPLPTMRTGPIMLPGPYAGTGCMMQPPPLGAPHRPRVQDLVFAGCRWPLAGLPAVAPPAWPPWSAWPLWPPLAAPA